jgi:uncharacterized protein YggE
MDGTKISAGLLALMLLPFAAAYVSTEGFGTSGYVGSGYAGDFSGCPGNLTDMPDFIVSGGEATVSVDASVMIANLKFVSRGATAKEAYEKQNEVMARVLKMLKSKNITETETTDFRITPIYNENVADGIAHSDWEAIDRYSVENTLVIKVRDRSIFNSVLVEATDLGVNEITDMRFIPDSETIKAARKRVKELALEDAKKNAVWQASVIGRGLGKMVSVGDTSEDAMRGASSSYGYYGYDRLASNMAAQTSMYLSDGPVEESEDSLSPGRVTFRASVSLGYLLG